MTLEQVKRGQSYRIVNFLDDRIRTQAIRFGMSEGEKVFANKLLKQVSLFYVKIIDR